MSLTMDRRTDDISSVACTQLIIFPCPCGNSMRNKGWRKRCTKILRRRMLSWCRIYDRLHQHLCLAMTIITNTGTDFGRGSRDEFGAALLPFKVDCWALSNRIAYIIRIDIINTDLSPRSFVAYRYYTIACSWVKICIASYTSCISRESTSRRRMQRYRGSRGTLQICAT